MGMKIPSATVKSNRGSAPTYMVTIMMYRCIVPTPRQQVIEMCQSINTCNLSALKFYLMLLQFTDLLLVNDMCTLTAFRGSESKC